MKQNFRKFSDVDMTDTDRGGLIIFKNQPTFTHPVRNSRARGRLTSAGTCVASAGPCVGERPVLRSSSANVSPPSFCRKTECFESFD